MSYKKVQHEWKVQMRVNTALKVIFHMLNVEKNYEDRENLLKVHTRARKWIYVKWNVQKNMDAFNLFESLKVKK